MKLSDLSPEQWFARLSARRATQAAQAAEWFTYYDGEQEMYHVAKLLAEQDDRFPALSINWAEKLVDAEDRRCITEGFRLAGTDDFDQRLWKIWTQNDLPEFESENSIASLVTGYSFMVAGPNDDGSALITVESPLQMAVEIDPRSRKTVASLLFYKSDQESLTDDRAVLQIAGVDGKGARQIEFENGVPAGEKTLKWMAQTERFQGSPDVPVVVFPNRQRQGFGRSELRSLRPLIDATNLIATHMLATSHFHAMPRMLAINIARAMFFNQDGSVNREAVKSATGSMWIVPAAENEQGQVMAKDDVPDIDIKQLPAADLRNFHESISLLGRIGAGLCDLDPASFGFGVADNPASADGIRAAHENFITRIERIQKARGTRQAQVMRLGAAIQGEDVAQLTGLETIWRDPAKPTKGAVADAAVKTLQSGIADLHQARVDYGYSATTIQEMEAREAAALRDPFTVPEPPNAGAPAAAPAAAGV